MDELSEDFADGDTLHAAQVNAMDHAINDLADLCPMAAAYRPLTRTPNALVTTNTLATGSTPAATTIAWNATGKHRFCGCVPVALTSNAFLGLNNNNTYANEAPGGNGSFNPIVFEFWTNATDLRIQGGMAGKPDVWALCDDQLLKADWQHMNFADGLYTWTLGQSAALWHKWRICLPNTLYQLSTNAGAAVVPTSPGFQLGVIGDSYLQGGISIANAVTPGTAGIILSGMPFGEFEQMTGFDVWRFGLYGTGYIAQSDFTTNGPYGSTRRMAAVAAAPPLDALVMFGSVNDSGQTSGALVAAANAAWTAAAVAQPGATLIVVGLESFGAASAPNDVLNAALKTAALAHDDVDAFVDVRAAKIMTGTGHDGAAAGDGNADVFLAGDSTHLTHMGARHWGENLRRLLGQVALNVAD